MEKRVLRIAALGDYVNYYSHFLAGVLEGSIRCGHMFRPIPLFGVTLKEVESMIDFFKPDVMFTHCIFNRRPHNRDEVFEMLRRVKKRYGTFVYYHLGDARKEPRYPENISDIVDAALVNSHALNRLSEIWGVPCFHWPYGCLYQENIEKVNGKFSHDIVFTGNLREGDEHHGGRTAFIEKLKSHAKIKIYPDENIGNSRFFTPEISSSSGAILGFQMGRDIQGYNDVRPYQYIGAGALFFQDFHENIEAVFKSGVHYVSFHRVDDLIERYKYYQQYPLEGKRIREVGFRYCQENHNYKIRVQTAIDIWRGKNVDCIQSG